MIIYKYLNEKGALATLENSAVLLRAPVDFNDPFDSLFFTTDEEKEKAFELFLNYQLFKNVYEDLIKNKKKPVRMKLLAGVIKEDIQLEASNIKKTKAYKLQPYLSIYYKLASKYLNKKDNELKNQFKQMINEVLANIRSSALVSCFGSSKDSILMWSHYADKHKGACFEYEIDDANFKGVTYSKNMPVFRFTDVLEIIFGHDFLGEEVDASKKEYQFILEPLLVKSDDWIYEGEIRCVYTKNKPNPKIHDMEDEEGIKTLLDMPRVKKIFIGCNASQDFIRDIKKKAGDISVAKMEIVPGEYRLEEKS